MRDLLEIAKSEMKLSLGCTEPASIGLASARTRQYMSGPAKQFTVSLGSNIFKNAFSVLIPNANCGGISLAIAIGYLLSKPGQSMELFSGITPEILSKANDMCENGFVSIKIVPSANFYIRIVAYGDCETVETITSGRHDNMAKVIRNGQVLFDTTDEFSDSADIGNDFGGLDISAIIDYCKQVSVKELGFIEEAIRVNSAVSAAGLEGDYGLFAGRTLKRLMERGILRKDLANYVKMKTTAASDYRMGGGNMAVMTLMGSGNQGIEAIIPVVAAAEFLEKDWDSKVNYVLQSVLLTIYIKSFVGRLSPICGATLAGAACSFVICTMLGGTIAQAKGAIQNMMGNLSGMVCDGAKNGCALKVGCCASEAVMAALLAINGSIIEETDGIICGDVEETLYNVGRLSKEAMANTDLKIIEMMQDKTPSHR